MYFGLMQKDRPPKSTIVDIARHANVSTATVDRVLNGRLGVHDDTKTRVIEVASQLGYRIRGNASPRSERVVLDFILPDPHNPFMQLVSDGLRNASSGQDADVNVHWLESFDPISLTALIQQVGPTTGGLGIIALDHILVREALLQLSNSGTAIVTLATDISSIPHQGYIGPDNRMAGRMAGHLIGRFVQGQNSNVALFTGSPAYRGHEEREMGFRHIIAEDFPHLRILRTEEVKDDDELAHAMVRDMFAGKTDIAAIYSIGAAATGVARALEELGVSRKVVFIAHELHEETRRHLIKGVIDAIIDQNPALLAQRAISRLIQAAHKMPLQPLRPIDTRLILAENVPHS